MPPATGSITKIQSYSTNRDTELAEFLSGTSRVKKYFRGAKTASITVEADADLLIGFEKGMEFTGVILTLEGAIHSGGAASGNDSTFTLSDAVVSEVGELAHGNEDSAPVVSSVTFMLAEVSTTSSEPTAAFAVSGS